MTKVSTDNGTVTSVTSSFNSSLSGLSFSCKESISYSDSTAMNGLILCLAYLDTSVQTFQSTAKTDVQNLTKIHAYIQETDQKLAQGGS